jgi:hypothetical protein
MRFFQHVLSLCEIERTWSDGPFVSAVLHLLASALERAA